MEIDRQARKLWSASRVDGEYKNLCIEYEYCVDLDCPRIWKITDDDTGKDVMVTLINSEDLSDIFEQIGNLK